MSFKKSHRFNGPIGRPMITTIIILLLLPVGANSQKIGVSSSLGFGCWNCAKKWNFGCKDELAHVSKCKCRNMNFMGTVLACISRHGFNEKDMDKGFLFVQNYCQNNGDKTYTKIEINEMYQTAASVLVDGGNLNTLERVYAPVEVDEPDFSSHFAKASTAKQQYLLGSIFGSILLGFWCMILSMGILNHLLKCRAPQTLERLTPPFVDWMRKTLVLSAIFGDSHSRPVRFLKYLAFSAPTRGQTLILITYLLLNAGTLGLLLDYNSLEEAIRYIGNRSGIIAFTQLPLVVLFACRNNPLIYLTGWPYSSFQVYHHWISRVVVLQGLLHGICFTWLAVLTSSTSFRWRRIVNWRFGNAALFVALFIMVTSYRRFRVRWFELFTVLHKFYFLLFMIGIYRHCADFGWMPWIHVTIGLYSMDRLVRLILICYTGTKSKALFRIVDESTVHAIITYSGRWVPYPGSYVYIRVLHKKLFWQAHPFSVVKSPNPNEFELMIKSRDGATNKLLDIASLCFKNELELSVLIEGPYGVSQPLRNYHTVVLLAGGVGITGVYSYANDLTERCHQCKVVLIWMIPDGDPIRWFGHKLLKLGKHERLKLEIYITAKLFTANGTISSALYTPLSSSLSNSRSLALSSSSLEVSKKACSIVIAGDTIPQAALRGIQDNNRATRKFKSSGELPPLPHSTSNVHYNFAPYLFHYRPDIQSQVGKYISDSKGSVAICSCGPPSFLDNIRYSVVKNIHECKSRVDYFEEAFSW